MCHSTRAIYYQSLSMIAHVCLSPRCQWWSVLLLPSLLSLSECTEQNTLISWSLSMLCLWYITSLGGKTNCSKYLQSLTRRTFSIIQDANIWHVFPAKNQNDIVFSIIFYFCFELLNCSTFPWYWASNPNNNSECLTWHGMQGRTFIYDVLETFWKDGPVWLPLCVHSE